MWGFTSKSPNNQILTIWNFVYEFQYYCKNYRNLGPDNQGPPVHLNHSLC